MSDQIIKDLLRTMPGVTIIPGESFFWSPEKKLITYNKKIINTQDGQWALLHEIAHAKLKHTSYKSDLALLKLEVEAWNEAKNIASIYNLEIDEDHIQDCLDTYRDWLYRRSSCPNCSIVCLQKSPQSYSCHNCHTTWSVSTSRFCRPYRLKLKDGKEKRPQSSIATFS